MMLTPQTSMWLATALRLWVRILHRLTFSKDQVKVKINQLYLTLALRPLELTAKLRFDLILDPLQILPYQEKELIQKVFSLRIAKQYLNFEQTQKGSHLLLNYQFQASQSSGQLCADVEPETLVTNSKNEMGLLLQQITLEAL